MFLSARATAPTLPDALGLKSTNANRSAAERTLLDAQLAARCATGAAALWNRLLELGWVIRQPGSRAVVITPAGRKGLKRSLGVAVLY